MKKLIAIILILLIIFFVMYMYKYNNLITNKKNEIAIDEITKIETYLQKIYMWKEITKDALPTFNNINEAPDIWIWEVVKKNIEEYELTYNQIQDKAKEMFGEDFNKEFDKKGYEYMEYDEETDKYYPIGIGLDNKEDAFLLNKIEKTDQGYKVEIIEYLEEYVSTQDGETTNEIIVENLDEEKIETIENIEDENNIQEIVKNNIERFTKKEIELKIDSNGRIYVVSVKNI